MCVLLFILFYSSGILQAFVHCLVWIVCVRAARFGPPKNLDFCPLKPRFRFQFLFSSNRNIFFMQRNVNFPIELKSNILKDPWLIRQMCFEIVITQAIFHFFHKYRLQGVILCRFFLHFSSSNFWNRDLYSILINRVCVLLPTPSDISPHLLGSFCSLARAPEAPLWQNMTPLARRHTRPIGTSSQQAWLCSERAQITKQFSLGPW